MLHSAWVSWRSWPLVSIVAVPVAVEILERYFGRPLAMAPGAVAAIVLKAALVPLAAGMAVRAILPTVAERLEAVVALVGKVLLPLAIVALLVSTFSAIWAFVGPSTILAIVIFIAAGLGIGHVLGGPDPDHAVVLALSTACRHPAIALAIATTNFPDQRFGPLIILYLICEHRDRHPVHHVASASCSPREVSNLIPVESRSGTREPTRVPRRPPASCARSGGVSAAAAGSGCWLRSVVRSGRYRIW